mmetsp:Transcript_24954/g.46578  ORF Transcript_24954/g.46578 Transcript_24954/m.46578 type:complete len:87 (-) Transcript_24954:180-440(-)
MMMMITVANKQYFFHWRKIYVSSLLFKKKNRYLLHAEASAGPAILTYLCKVVYLEATSAALIRGVHSLDHVSVLDMFPDISAFWES